MSLRKEMSGDSTGTEKKGVQQKKTVSLNILIKSEEN